MDDDEADGTNTAQSAATLFEEEIAQYLSFYLEPRLSKQENEEQLRNPLHWRKDNEARFPTVARMTQDYLAIPATSVSVERLFSQSKHVCSDLRASLKPKTITQSLLTKMWIKSGLLEMSPPVIKRRKHGEKVAAA